MATQRQYVNMLGRFIIITVILLAISAHKAQASENYFLKVEKNTNLENFEWTQRPIVIFANSDKDPNFISQMELKSNNG